jgi:hypothetical protein
MTMTKSISTRGDWRPASVSFAVAGALAAFMLFLGARGLLAAHAAAQGFGLPVADADETWLRIKAGRDLCAGLTLAIFLALRSTRVMAAMLLGNVLIPVNDMLVSLSAPVHDAAYAVAVHGGAATLMVVLAGALLAGAGADAGGRDPGAGSLGRSPDPAVGNG